jgi:hypothetical protein
VKELPSANGIKQLMLHQRKLPCYAHSMLICICFSSPVILFSGNINNMVTNKMEAFKKGGQTHQHQFHHSHLSHWSCLHDMCRLKVTLKKRKEKNRKKRRGKKKGSKKQLKPKPKIEPKDTLRFFPPSQSQSFCFW